MDKREWNFLIPLIVYFLLQYSRDKYHVVFIIPWHGTDSLRVFLVFFSFIVPCDSIDFMIFVIPLGGTDSVSFVSP